MRARAIRLIGLIAIAPLLLSLTPAVGAEVRVPDCPVTTWSAPASSDEPKVLGYYFGATDKYFYRVERETKKPVSSAVSIIGCYISDVVSPIFDSAGWDVGVIDRDSIGYFWRNAAGRIWRLTPDFQNTRFLTGSDNPYQVFGKTFELTIPFDSKKVSTCRIPSLGSSFGPGFSRIGYRLYGKTDVKVAIIIPEFIDDPIKINFKDTVDGLDLTKVREYFKLASYNKVNLSFYHQDRTFKIPGKSSDFIDESTAVNAKVFQIMRLAYEEFKKTISVQDFDVLVFALPKEYPNPHAGFATDLSGITGKYFDDARTRITWMGSQPHAWGKSNDEPWKVVVHELGHNFGLPDLYSTTNTEKMNNYIGKTIGPFDIMGSLSAKGNELTFWSRWLLGWLQDSQVECVANIKDPLTFDLSPVGDNDGKTKGIVIPTSLSTAYLIESRRAQGYDSRLSPDEVGLVVYYMDTKISTGQGPIRVIPKVNEYTDVPYSQNLFDMIRFLKAPLQVGDSLVTEGIRIINVGDESRDKVLITLGGDPRPVSNFTLNLEKSYTLDKKELSLQFQSTASGVIETKTLTPEICTAQSSRVTLIDIGVCRFSARQNGNGSYLPSTSVEFTFEILPDPQIEVRKNEAKVAGSYLLAPECHAKGANGEVQIRDAQGNWQFLTSRFTAEIAQNGCPPTHPYVMWGIINAPQDSVLRWRFWSSSWEVFGREFVWINQVERGKELAASIAAAEAAAAIAAAAKKKVTIVCIKGKLTKKVTGVKPKCPTGYKIKK